MEYNVGSTAKVQLLLLPAERVMVLRNPTLSDGAVWPVVPAAADLTALAAFLFERAERVERDQKQGLAGGGTSRSRASVTCKQGRCRCLALFKICTTVI